MKRRLLVVDDNGEDRFTIRRMLRDADREIELLEAESGEEGLALLDAQPFDAVLLDYRLPDVDGIEFLERLPRESWNERPAIIALTGQGNEAVASKMMKAGADDYLIKASITADVLDRALVQAVNKVQLERRIESRNRELAVTNAALQREIEERLAAERRLQDAQQSLEHLVEERTRELSRSLARELDARAEAERASRAKDEFLGVVSHELRTPLNAILGWIELIRARRNGTADLERGLETIERNARALTVLVSDLLDVSRIDGRKFTIERAPVAFGSLVASVAEDMRPLAARKGIEVELNAGESNAVVMGDGGRLQQALENILMNAIKFTEEGRIRIAVVEDAERVAVRITDTGVGIEPAFLPHVFERFRQADSSSSRRYGGLGLGLAITKEVVEQHEGTLAACSDGPGSGTTVEVTLPRSEAVPVAQEHVTARSFPVSLEGIRVLLVDDDADSRDLVGQVLERCGAIVELARDAESAIESFRRCAPDVLVSDIGLPGLDGFGLLECLMRERPARPVPAIAVTAYAGEEDRRQILAAGFRYHLAKPLRIDELLQAIRHVSGQPA